MQSECIVVGGGLIGLSSARELARGGLRVLLLERGRLGREASWAGAGVLAALEPRTTPTALQALLSYSQERYADLARDLQVETGIDSEWTRSGLLLVGPDAGSQALAWRTTGEPVEAVDPAALPVLEPALSISGPAWRVPAVAQIRNPRLLRALRGALAAAGVAIREHCAVRALRHARGRILGVETAGQRIDAMIVVIAAGPWSGSLLDGLPHPPIVFPVRGQMLLYRTPPDTLRHIVQHGEVYLVPRRDGMMLVGSTVEHVGFDKTVTGEARAALHSAAGALVPALVRQPIVDHWAGLRPGSGTGMPVIAGHPEVHGLYANTGHFRNGLVLAPGSARLLCDLILRRAPIVAPEPFAWRAPKG
ncbi:MAG: glycine oxidase ThiO [Beggiatoa sp.]|nr:glycine oxidase ThiO [Beggiatoa sp.]